uniref:Ribosomal protein S20 n=1 Tax=Crouania attenuata TaxID=42002 RepID=A0A4D6WS07_9FLOR|nr:ribosomal protein S20 [Crouania attenuata]
MSKNLSVIKRSNTSLRNRQRNRIYKSIIKTFTKKYLSHFRRENLNVLDINDAKASLSLVYQKIDKAVKRGVFHKNKGARHKSKLAKLIKIYSS